MDRAPVGAGRHQLGVVMPLLAVVATVALPVVAAAGAVLVVFGGSAVTVLLLQTLSGLGDAPRLAVSKGEAR